MKVYYSAIHDQIFLEAKAKTCSMSQYHHLYSQKFVDRSFLWRLDEEIDCYDIHLGERDGWLICLGNI